MVDQFPRTEGRRGRIAKACSQCRVAKTRCTFSDGSKVCDKCIQRGLDCSMLPQGATDGSSNSKAPSGTNSQANAAPFSPQSSSSSSSTLNGLATASNTSATSNKTDPVSSKASASYSSLSPHSIESQYNGWIGGDSPQPFGGSVSGGSSSGEKPNLDSPPLRLSIASLHDASISDGTTNPGTTMAKSSIVDQIGDPITDSVMESITNASLSNISLSDPPLSGTSISNNSISNTSMTDSMMMMGGQLGGNTPDLESGSISTNSLDAGGPGTLQSGFHADPTGEYFLNLGVFPEPLTKEMIQSRSQSPFNDPMMNSMVNPVVPSNNTRFKFQHSAASMVLQAIDPVLQDQMGAISRLLLPPRALSSRNVINQRILSYSQVVRLFGFFKGNYNHWISLPDAEPEELANYLLEQCPLLVTTCCCIALRFGSPELWQSTYPALVRYLTFELAQTLVQLPLNIECLQALTILAKYADALSYGDFVFDMWYISGIGIQHLETVASLNDQFTYIHMRLWNHLVLAHVTSANISGRGVLIDEGGMQMCRLVLSENVSTRFDSCMVAELMIQWLTSKYLSRKISYADFEQGVAEWQQEWGMLAQLPMIQFVEPVLLFCCFLSRWTYTQRCFGSQSPPITPQGDDFSLSNANNMSTENLIEELGNLVVIVNSLLSMVHSDYFGCLSDSLHGIGFISAVMSMVIIKVIIARRDSLPLETKHQLNTCVQLVSQLVLRFRATSRGQDIFQTRCVALTQLLKASSLV